MSMPTSWSRVLTTFCALLLLTTGAYAAKSGTIDFASLSPADAVPGELLVKYRPTITTSGHASVHTAAAVGGKAKYSFRTIPWQVVKIPDNVALQAAADAYRSDPRVMLVEPNYIVHAIETVPNDPNYGDLWGMARIDAPFAWDISTGNSTVLTTTATAMWTMCAAGILSTTTTIRLTIKATARTALARSVRLVITGSVWSA